MTSDHDETPDELTSDVADDGTIEPPIWIPIDDAGAADAAKMPAVPQVAAADEPGRLELQTGLPMSVLAGGAAVVLLAAAVVFGIIATRGPSTSPDSSSPAAVRKPAVTESATESATEKPSLTPAARPMVSCRYARSQEGSVPRRVDLPQATGIVKSGRIDVELRTNQGRVALSLDRARTPCTTHNFLALAAQRFFDDTPCHRITTRGLFVLQCGDPGGTGGGGPGYSFADENLPRMRTEPVTYPTGTVAMANVGPDTNGSQFFIVYQDTQLMPTWTVFARVTAGLDLVQSVAAAGSRPDGDGKPKRPVTIMSVGRVSIERSEARSELTVMPVPPTR